MIECIHNYSDSILQLFDLDSLFAFLLQIDKVAKEKGTQVIQHFINSKKLEQVVADVNTATDPSTANPYSSVPLSDSLETQADYLCEEISNFSYLFRTYYNFISSVVFK